MVNLDRLNDLLLALVKQQDRLLLNAGSHRVGQMCLRQKLGSGAGRGFGR